MSTASTPHTAPATYHARRARPGPVLVATSGTSATDALVAARLLAARTGSDVVALSVVEPPTPWMSGFDGMPIAAPDPGVYVALRRERVAAQLRDALGADVAWPVEVVVGDRARTLAEEADARGASLIVMGTGRHGVAARLRGGEITLRTIRHARVPVLAVAGPLDASPRVAVAAVDFSPTSVAAARAALALLDPGATLYVVHAWSRSGFEHPDVRAQEDAYEHALPGLFARVEAALADGARDVTVRAVSLVGKPAEEVLDFARTHDAGLIAVGKRGHGLLERLFLGHVSADVVRAASCAVLVTPEPPLAERVAILRALVGTVESTAPEEWAELLDGFSRRNRGRRAALEVDDPALGAQAQETGAVLHGAAYDPHDGRVELMFGDAAGGTAHLTRLVAGVTSVAVVNDADGHDVALRLAHGDTQTLLTFPPGA